MVASDYSDPSSGSLVLAMHQLFIDSDRIFSLVGYLVSVRMCLELTIVILILLASCYAVPRMAFSPLPAVVLFSDFL